MITVGASRVWCQTSQRWLGYRDETRTAWWGRPWLRRQRACNSCDAVYQQRFGTHPRLPTMRGMALFVSFGTRCR